MSVLLDENLHGVGQLAGQISRRERLQYLGAKLLVRTVAVKIQVCRPNVRNPSIAP